MLGHCSTKILPRPKKYRTSLILGRWFQSDNIFWSIEPILQCCQFCGFSDQNYIFETISKSWKIVKLFLIWKGNKIGSNLHWLKILPLPFQIKKSLKNFQNFEKPRNSQHCKIGPMDKKILEVRYFLGLGKIFVDQCYY